MINYEREMHFWRIIEKNKFLKKIYMNLMIQSYFYFLIREVLENVTQEYKSAEG